MLYGAGEGFSFRCRAWQLYVRCSTASMIDNHIAWSCASVLPLASCPGTAESPLPLFFKRLPCRVDKASCVFVWLYHHVCVWVYMFHKICMSHVINAEHDPALADEDVALHRCCVCPPHNAKFFASCRHPTGYINTSNNMTMSLHCLRYNIACSRPFPSKANPPPSLEKARRLRCLKLDCS